jgi:hypothetical protein
MTTSPRARRGRRDRDAAAAGLGSGRREATGVFGRMVEIPRRGCGPPWEAGAGRLAKEGGADVASISGPGPGGPIPLLGRVFQGNP